MPSHQTLLAQDQYPPDTRLHVGFAFEAPMSSFSLSNQSSLSRRQLLTAGAGALTLAACGGSGNSSSLPVTHSWVMDFGFNPPRYTTLDVLHTIDLFASRADCCIVHEEIPWTKRLANPSPTEILTADSAQLHRH